MGIVITQSLIFLSFVTFIVVKFGVQPSISDSWYKLGNLGFLFTLFIWGIALPMCMIGTGWYFGSGALLAFVGAATAFKSKGAHTNIVHSVGAVGGILFALLALAIEGIWLPAVIVPLATIGLKVCKMRNLIWWIEISAFVVIELGLLYKFHAINH